MRSGASASGFALKSSQFRREREPVWRELEALVGRVERSGLESLTAEELHRLPALYRSAVSSLSVAHAISLDRNLLDYLTALAGRAYVCVYGNKQQAGDAVADFFLRRFPRTVRRYLPALAASLLALLLGIATGFHLTLADPERYDSFVPPELAQGRNPASSSAELRDVLYHRDEEGKSSPLMVFATFLFTHNAKIGLLCFALGFAAGVPVVFLLFSNGLGLGAMAALYDSRGLGSELWAWMLPHGVTELAAAALCGAAGLAVGARLIFPGPHARLHSLALRGREVSLLVLGAVVMFLIAGLIEGFFRQLVHDTAARWTVAGATLVFWTGYFLLAGRGHERRGV